MRALPAAIAVLAVMLAMPPVSKAQQPVLQRGYDAGVSGANLAETILNTGNVAPATFGLVFKLPVDDDVFAQPLYVPGVAVSGRGTHNVVYVATMSDTLYAFDADNGAQLWSTNFAESVGAAAVPIARFAFSGNRNIVGNLGILSTPVIDVSTQTLYLVACTLEGGAIVYRLHAVDITSGAELVVSGGTIIAGNHGSSTFDSRGVTQRVSLALSGNQIVFGFGALQEEASDVGGYAGWIFAYDKNTLARSGSFATMTSGSRGGGVWQSGRPPVVDASGNIYVFVGNGYSSYDGINNFNESVLKLDPGNGLNLVDWFTPGNWNNLDTNDADLTSSGPMLIPGTDLLTGGGKAGVLYVLDTDNLGKETANDNGALQEQSIASGELRGGPVYWDRSTAGGGPLLFDWGAGDVVKAYPFNGTTIAGSPSAQGSSPQTWPGGILTLSASGSAAGTGILWANAAVSGDAENNPPVPGILYALDASNVGRVLWDSTQNSARDNFGQFAKFVPPLVSNGRVYVATSSNQVAVYGLLTTFSLSSNTLAFGNQVTNAPSAAKAVTLTNTGAVAVPITGIALSTAGAQPFAQTNTCGSSLAVGATCSIAVVFDPATAGNAAATLTITAGSAAAQSVALSGTGVAPTFSVSTAALTFGSELVDAPSPPQSITVTNTSAAPLSLSAISLSTTGSQPFGSTNACGTLAAGASCTISIVFDPAAVGAAAATLSVTGSNGAGTKTIAVSGTGIQPSYSLSTVMLDFGTVFVDVPSGPQSITVTNTGTAPLPISGISLSNSGTRPFAQSNTCGSALAAGSTCAINVMFDPGAVGAASATLSINSGNAAPSQTVTLTGTGVAPSYTLSTTTLAFGNQVIGVMGAPKTVTLTNSSNAALPVTGITLSSAGAQSFVQTNDCASSLAAGAACSISVVFDPTSTGAAAATLTVAVGDGAGTQSVALDGTGTVLSVTLTASPATIGIGGTVSLNWTANGATSCTASGGQSGDGWGGTRPTSGTASVNTEAAGTITYTLNCSIGSKSAQAQARVTATSTSVSGGGAFDAMTLAALLGLVVFRWSRLRFAAERSDARKVFDRRRRSAPRRR